MSTRSWRCSTRSTSSARKAAPATGLWRTRPPATSSPTSAATTNWRRPTRAGRTPWRGDLFPPDKMHGTFLMMACLEQLGRWSEIEPERGADPGRTTLDVAVVHGQGGVGDSHGDRASRCPGRPVSYGVAAPEAEASGAGRRRSASRRAQCPSSRPSPNRPRPARASRPTVRPRAPDLRLRCRLPGA
jgi:hypothetical protein